MSNGVMTLYKPSESIDKRSALVTPRANSVMEIIARAAIVGFQRAKAATAPFRTTTFNPRALQENAAVLRFACFFGVLLTSAPSVSD